MKMRYRIKLRFPPDYQGARRRHRIAATRTNPNGTAANTPILPNPANPTNEFHPFLRLPHELRQAIFALSLPANGNIIVISRDGKRITQGEDWEGSKFEYGAKAAYRIPALLHVNIEARAMALRRYTLVFGAQLRGNPVAVDLKMDVILFKDPMAIVHFYGGVCPGWGFAVDHMGRDITTIHDMTDLHTKIQRIAMGRHDGGDIIGQVINRCLGVKEAFIEGEDWATAMTYSSSFWGSEDVTLKQMILKQVGGNSSSLDAGRSEERSKELGNMPKVRFLEPKEFRNRLVEIRDGSC